MSDSIDPASSAYGLFEKMRPWQRWWRRRDKQRLNSEMVLAKVRYGGMIERLPSKGGPSDGERERLLETQGELLRQAEAALVSGDIDGGWRCLQELELEMVPLLDASDLDARFVSAVSEARRKVGKWRLTSVEEQAKRFEGVKVDQASTEEDRCPSSSDAPAAAPSATDDERLRIKRSAFSEVLRHLHATHQNLYHKLGKLQRQVQIVGLLVLLVLGMILVLNAQDFFHVAGRNVQQQLWLAIVAGLLGGVLSLAFSVARPDPERRIPDVSMSFVVTSIRPVLGAAIALPVLLLVESGLLNLPGESRHWVLLALCFVGGFSERWFLDVMSGIDRRTRATD